MNVVVVAVTVIVVVVDVVILETLEYWIIINECC